MMYEPIVSGTPEYDHHMRMHEVDERCVEWIRNVGIEWEEGALVWRLFETSHGHSVCIWTLFKDEPYWKESHYITDHELRCQVKERLEEWHKDRGHTIYMHDETTEVNREDDGEEITSGAHTLTVLLDAWEIVEAEKAGESLPVKRGQDR